MNQFANIGSMFPGANHKRTRDKAKEILSAHPSFEITGIVITNQATKKKHYIDQGIHGELDYNTVISETLRCQGIAAREYGYWKEGGDGCEGCICAMGAAANILASIARGLSPEEHDEWKKSNGHEPVGPMSETASQFVNDVKSHMDELEEMFSLMLIAEVKRHGGIPKLSEEEMKFRDTLSEFLMTKAHWSQMAPPAKPDDLTDRLDNAREALQELYDNAMIQRGANDDPLICYDRKTFLERLKSILASMKGGSNG